MNNIYYHQRTTILVVLLVLLFLLTQAFFIYSNDQAGMAGWDLTFSAILLSLPLGLLYISAGLLVAAEHQKRTQGKFSSRMAKTIYLTPRIAGILIAFFISLFALDVFSAEASVLENIGGFLIHASPAIILAILLAFAWHREWIGFVGFLGAGLYFMRLFDIGVVLLFSAPMIVIAMLFWANWKWQKELQLAQKPLSTSHL